ncbi:MAG: hypothetical protein M3454_01520, partial [Actinomycetota bacterium]|nr:hypothetical protein [Actinomycetota bacterium]
VACLVAGAALLGVGVAASAQELSIPVMVQTRPEIPGVRFALDGKEFVANQHGLAVTTVPSSGTYELAVLSPRIEGEGASHSFTLWSEGERIPSRALDVSSFTLLEAGFDTTRHVTFSFTDQSGEAIEPDRIGQATIAEVDRDNRYRIDAGRPTSLIASRAMANENGVALEPVSYRLIEAAVDGKNVYNLESNIEIGIDSAAGIPVALSQGARGDPVESAPSATPSSEDGRRGLEWTVSAALMGLLFAIVTGVWLWRNLGGRGLLQGSFHASWEITRWGGGPTAVEANDAGGRVPGWAGKKDSGRSGVDHLLRVHMKNGRIIDGWSRSASQTSEDEALTLFRVEQVYDQDGNEVVSSPLDVFLPRSQVARIEHIDAWTDPPPSIGPSADVVRLEENHMRKPKPSAKETVDLRSATSKKTGKPQRSKNRSA